MRLPAALLSASLSLSTLALGLAGSGCGGPEAAVAPGPAAARGPDDEEAGVKRITTLMREFGRTLETKDFETASTRLRDAENAVKNASGVTRGHPDFDEIEERVRRARPRLEAAIERDRIERRNAAIAALVKRGEQLEQRADVLLGELAKRVPEREDMNNLKELIDDFAALDKDGSGFMDDRGFQTHVQARDRIAAMVIGRRRQAEWQIQTSAAVGRTVEQAFAAMEDAGKSTVALTKLSDLRGASEAFTACVNAIADAESLGGFETTTVLTTRLGTYPVAETKKRCLESSGKMRLQAEKLSFLERAGAVARRVDAAAKAVAVAATAETRVTAAEAELEALAFCQADLEAALRSAGVDPTATFATALGTGLSATKLRQACVSERTKLAQSLPALRWRKGFEAMKPGLATIQQHLDEAVAATEVPQQLQRWQVALENLRSCVEKADALAHEKDADLKYAFVTALGSLTVTGVSAECKRQATVAESHLSRALEAKGIESFVQSCRGDEVAVARREGVPTQVVPVEGGRAFVYGKGPGARSFGFDAGGKSVDFAVRWREGVEAVSASLTSTNRALKAADGAVAALAATQAAVPVYESCIEALTGAERHPGYDAKLRLATDFGKLGAVELRAACLKRRAELAASVPGLKWRAQLEQVRDRAVEAGKKVEESRKLEDLDKRIAAAGAGLGGYRECTERVDSLAGAPDADKKLTVASPFGPVNVLGLGKACSTAMTTAQAALDAALAAAKLEQFITTCKADEVEVTRREGMPDRIERKGAGRVFVFEAKGKKGKARRFAFDASGTRVEEAVLAR